MTLYLLCNVLLLAAYPLVVVWRLPNYARLWLTRVVLFSCIAGPLAFHFAPPLAPQTVMRSVTVDAIGETVARVPPSVGARSLAVSKPRSADAKNALLVVVLAGVVVGLVRLGRDSVRIRSILRRAVPFRRRGAAHVLVSGDVNVPFSFRGLWNKHVVLPVSMLERPFDMRLAVSHEAQHHRQGDCLLAYPQELLRVVFFLNPMIHLWLRKLGELQELACDEALIVERRYSPSEYGDCLIRVARRAASREMACAVAMATRPLIQRRIVMLFNYQTVAPRKLWLSLIAYLAALTPTLSLAYTVAAQPPSTQVDRSHVEGRLQRIAEEEARDALAKNKATSAAVVVVEPSTGNILAFAEAGTRGWETRAIPAGSVIKPLLFEAAMKRGLVTPDTVLDCRGAVTLDGHAFKDREPSEFLSVKEALAKSSNVGALRVAAQLGLSGINDALAAYGLPCEALSSSEGEAVRVAKVSVGESVKTTVAVLARAYAKLAREGGDSIRDMLAHAVTKGTGSRAALPGASVAGKTGTVQMEGTVLASFVGFVPADAPKYVIYTVVENPKGSTQSGGEVAAPVFQRVALRGLNGK